MTINTGHDHFATAGLDLLGDPPRERCLFSRCRRLTANAQRSNDFPK
jgi:hypothetical protein